MHNKDGTFGYVPYVKPTTAKPTTKSTTEKPKTPTTDHPSYSGHGLSEEYYEAIQPATSKPKTEKPKKGYVPYENLPKPKPTSKSKTEKPKTPTTEPKKEPTTEKPKTHDTIDVHPEILENGDICLTQYFNGNINYKNILHKTKDGTIIMKTTGYWNGKPVTKPWMTVLPGKNTNIGFSIGNDPKIVITICETKDGTIIIQKKDLETRRYKAI